MGRISQIRKCAVVEAVTLLLVATEVRRHHALPSLQERKLSVLRICFPRTFPVVPVLLRIVILQIGKLLALTLFLVANALGLVRVSLLKTDIAKKRRNLWRM